MLSRHPKVLVSTAIHEAGHTFAAFHYGIKIKHISINAPDEWTLGYVHEAKSVDWDAADLTPLAETKAIFSLVFLLAGGEAERAAMGRRNHIGARRDQQRATDLADLISGGSVKEGAALLRYTELRTRRLISFPLFETAIYSLADELLRHRALAGKIAFDLIRAATQRG